MFSETPMLLYFVPVQKKRTEERFRTLREFVLWGPQLGRVASLKSKIEERRCQFYGMCTWDDILADF